MGFVQIFRRSDPGALSIDDLYRVTGVGVRTLQRCFKEHFDLTIFEYIQTVGLNESRR